MDFDVLGKIFDHLDWKDQLSFSHIIHRKPTQYSIALKRLQAIGFCPLKCRDNVYQHALNTGNLELCTEALYRMYNQIFDGTVERSFIRSDLLNKSRCSRIRRVLRAFRYLQTWDFGLD